MPTHKAADGSESRLETRVASCDRRGEGCPRRSSAFQELGEMQQPIVI